MSNVNHKTPRERMIERVQATKIIKRVNDCALGKIEMTNEQLRAAQMCMAKVIPDLKATEVTHSGEMTIQEVRRVLVNAGHTDS